jgi:EAL and modified HD-GYP domain-containing signal transduction protein
METILSGLPLSADITDALLYGEGFPGEILRKVIAYEHGDWDKVTFQGIDVREITSAYLDSVRWAKSSITSVL